MIRNDFGQWLWLSVNGVCVSFCIRAWVYVSFTTKATYSFARKKYLINDNDIAQHLLEAIWYKVTVRPFPRICCNKLFGILRCYRKPHYKICVFICHCTHDWYNVSVQWKRRRVPQNSTLLIGLFSLSLHEKQEAQFFVPDTIWYKLSSIEMYVIFQWNWFRKCDRTVLITGAFKLYHTHVFACRFLSIWREKKK